MNYSPKNKKKIKLLPVFLGFFSMLVLAWVLLPIFFKAGDTIPAQASNATSFNGSGNVKLDFAAIMEHQMPPHTFFAPLAHSKDSCNECHNFNQNQLLAHFNIVAKVQSAGSGATLYSVMPLTMAECQRCHSVAAHISAGAGNSCGTCHR